MELEQLLDPVYGLSVQDLDDLEYAIKNKAYSPLPQFGHIRAYWVIVPRGTLFARAHVSADCAAKQATVRVSPKRYESRSAAGF